MDIINASLRYMSEKHRSEKKVRSFLNKKFSSSSESYQCVKSVLDELKSEHLIDDGRLARTLALQYTHKGNRFIADLLREKGISEQIISNTLSHLDTEVQRALIEINKRLKGQWNNSEKTFSFASRFLGGRKFSHLTISIVINELSLSTQNHRKVA